MPIYPNKNLKKKIQKILLVNPPGKITVTKEGSRERKLAVPPLGLAYLAAGLLKHGFEVEILDILIEGFYNESVVEDAIIYGLNDKEIKERILESNPDLIGVSCIISNRSKEVVNVCKLAKEIIPDVHVLIGGQHPSGMPEMILDKNVDFILRGESDNSLIDLIKRINGNKDLISVAGIVLKDKEEIYINKIQDYPDVKTLPYPAWDIFKLEKYWNAGVCDYEINPEEQKRFLIMMTSRGCPHHCYFCTSELMGGRRYRQRDSDDVIKEIKLYKEKYNIEKIHFWDDNFFVNKDRAKTLLKFLIENFKDIEFEIPSGSEVNAIDGEMIDLMAKAGFKKLFLAVESPNETIQEKLIDKRVKLYRVPDVVKDAQNKGLIVEGSFMVGFPGETKEQMDNTFELAKKMGFDRISISIVNPLPGTPLYGQCKKENLLYPDYDPKNIRWSAENIKLSVPRGYLSKRRRETWVEYMKNKIDINKYEKEKVNSLNKQKK
ncbi:MAG: radical SAM protein [Candidatus Nealsonbacteria bacterium]|nr:radical SAM protein [Candidatus Nealsonbacteria bacterium]